MKCDKVELRSALSQLLGIEESEIGAHAAPSRDLEHQPSYSIYLFDTATGGAGYVGQTAYHLPKLIEKAESILHCPKNCDSACQACLLTYDTQHHSNDINRHNALVLLSRSYLSSFELPEQFKVFGPTSILEMEPLIMAFNREWQKYPISKVRVYFGGDFLRWDPLAWKLRTELSRLNDANVQIQFILPPNSLEKLSFSQKSELEALAAYVNAKVYITETITTEGISALPVILEAGSDQINIRWVATSESALAPTPRWGSGESDIQFIFGRFEKDITPEPYKAKLIDIKGLRLPVPGLIELEIGQELDGPSYTFGERAWQLISTRVPKLTSMLHGEVDLLEVIYSDRYLKSPLVLILLNSFLSALCDYPKGIKKNTKLSIVTSRLERLNNESPRRLFHDWSNARDRSDTINSWYIKKFSDFSWDDNYSNTELPHERKLQLNWADGSQSKIILDQGVGYWRLVQGIRTEFPFEKDTSNQVNYLEKANVIVESLSKVHPTHWYFGNNS